MCGYHLFRCSDIEVAPARYTGADRSYEQGLSEDFSEDFF
jgi:hypothetical protein